MQKLVLYSAIVLTVILGCSKDKFEDKPNVKIKSVSPGQVAYGESLDIDMEFTDKQGDLDSVWVKKLRLNTKPVQQQLSPLLVYEIPDFPEKSKGELKISIDYQTSLISAQPPHNQPGAPNNTEPDTLIFQIVVKDKGGHYSDTAATGPVVVERKP
jgi:hypothetical protein